MIQSIIDWLAWFYHHIQNLLCGVFFALVAYLAEIQGAVHVMWIALALDLITGIGASVWKRKEKFDMDKLFVAVGRAIGATVLVALLYAMDREMQQDIAASYNIAAWLICGFYAWSASENMDSMFGGRLFGLLKLFFERRVESASGIDISEEPKNRRHHDNN